MIVVDVGAYSHPDHRGASQDSVGRLIERFHPSVVYAFDPLHEPTRFGGPAVETVGETRVFRDRTAAWTHDREVLFDPSPASPLSASVREDGTETVRCLDLARFLKWVGDDGGIVLKLDCEGGEYVLLPWLIEQNAFTRVQLVLVEWHDLPARTAERNTILGRIPAGVAVEEWTD